MPVRGIALGRADEATHRDSIRAVMAEFFSMLIFVFASEGSVMAYAKLTGGDATTPSGLVAVALAHALSLFVAVAVAINISGGHVNPAVTFGAMMGGHISILRAILYWIAQILGALIASLLLKFATNGRSTSPFAVSPGVGSWNPVVLEIVMTFGLVYTMYATAIDAKRGSLETIAPLAIGFIVGANILAGGAFDGAAMNPARAFGPAFVSGKWQYHWIYWVGPLIGGGLAGLLYEWLMVPLEPLHQPLQPNSVPILLLLEKFVRPRGLNTCPHGRILYLCARNIVVSIYILMEV